MRCGAAQMAAPQRFDALPAANVSAVPANDLQRDVYCILGMPIDAINMADVVKRIDEAVATRSAFRISTPNLNFLSNSLFDKEFRETLLDSDLCPVMACQSYGSPGSSVCPSRRDRAGRISSMR